MTVIRLRTRKGAAEQASLAEIRDMLLGLAGDAKVRDRLVALVEREISSRSGWRFIMVEPRLYAEVVAYLDRHSRRPRKAVQLWARLFAVLPPDSNEVLASRDELASMVGIEPRTVCGIKRSCL